VICSQQRPPQSPMPAAVNRIDIVLLWTCGAALIMTA
jgi:hypothetical protein